MEAMLPFDIDELLARTLLKDERPPDGKLHPSGALTGSLRHLQLEMAGAPTIAGGSVDQFDIVSGMRSFVGTAVHHYFENVVFRGKPGMFEVKLDEWMLPGWSGTADWLLWDAERRAFVLGDLKTCKPGAIHHILTKGAKESHIWQISMYWHALYHMGIPLVDGWCIYYLPYTQLLAREGAPVRPTLQVGYPLPWEAMKARAEYRQARVDEYLTSLPIGESRSVLANYLTDALEPVQEREIRLTLNKQLKRPVIDAKLHPNWSTEFCPFPTELCDCREQKVNKIGHWDRDDAGRMVYTPSKTAEPHTPPAPEPNLIAALVKAQQEKEAA